MAEARPCDFCGSPVIWTPAEVNLDLALKLSGSPFCTGLGVMCNACGDKEIASAIRDMERAEAEENDDA